MVVKKANGRVFGAVLSKAEQRALDIEIQKQCADYYKRYENEIEAMILWNLHTELGFGKKRLLRFHSEFSKNMSQLVSQYEMDDHDTSWICLTKLKNYGIDLQELNNREELIKDGKEINNDD